MGTINFRGSKNFDVVGVGYKEYTDEADLNANLDNSKINIKYINIL